MGETVEADIVADLRDRAGVVLEELGGAFEPIAADEFMGGLAGVPTLRDAVQL